MTINLSTKGSAGSIAPFFNEPKQATTYTAGHYYGPSITYGQTAVDVIAQDFIIYIPFVPFANHTFLAIGVYNSNAADTGDNFRLGIYDDTGAGRPGDLVVDAGEVTLDAAAALREIVISEALIGSTLYWLALVGDSATEFVSAADSAGADLLEAPMLSTYGFDSYQTVAGGVFHAVKEAHSYAALPATADADTVSTDMPLILMKG